MKETIVAIVIFVFAAVFFVFAIMHFLKKGPLLNNSYLWVPQKDREKIDKSPYYLQSAIAFLLVALAITAIGINCLTNSLVFLILSVVFIIAAVIYAVGSAIALGVKGK